MKMDWGVLLGSMITQDLTMDQHKVDLITLRSELHAEDHLFILLSISQSQGRIRLFQYLAGLKEFQSIWHLVSKALVEKRDGQTQRNQMERRISKLLMLKTFWSWPR